MKLFNRDAGLTVKKTVTLQYGSADAPAASIDLIKKNGVSFEKKVESAVKLQKELGVGGLRWDVIALIDESYSMDNMFHDGTVQQVVERALAWTAGVDADGMAPVGGFHTWFDWHGEVDLSNVMGIVGREGWHTSGSTNLALGLENALDVAKQATNPVYLFIVTDGAPNDRAAVTRLIQRMSQYPIFIKILLVGDDFGGANFVQSLDDMQVGRLFDNVDAQQIRYPNGVSDDEFNRMMTEELSSAVAEMKSVGLAI